MAAPRRLAAVMFTDLASFTSRAHHDEARTLRMLQEHREIVRPIIRQFDGREVKTMGDGFLVEFDSARNAMLCALEIQRRGAEWVRASEEDRPATRIGLHVGEVVHEEGDILGDAVNVASRLEPLAEPGGICISGAMYEQVHRHVPARFDKLPRTRLKGIDSVMDVYRVTGLTGGAPPGGSTVGRVAVLPFASIGPNARDSYLADGLTDELIGALSQLGGLRVIARTSVDVYRDRAKPVSQIGSELNVRSVLEGSVRKHGNKLRVFAQLIDVPSQENLWSQTFDRELDDVFALQSEIAEKVAGALEVKVLEQEERRLRTKPTGVTASYLAYLKGRALLREMNAASLTAARKQFEEALRLDPKNARAHSGLADAIARGAQFSGQPLKDVLATLERSRDLAQSAVLADPSAAEAHATLGLHLDELYDFVGADRELRMAISLNPSYAPAHQWYGRLLTERGRLDEALEEYQIAEQADPLSPGVQFSLASLALAAGREREAVEAARRLSELEPDGIRVHLIGFERALRLADAPGMLAAARGIADRSPSSGREEQEALWLGRYDAAVGDAAGAREQIRRLEALHAPGTSRHSGWAAGEIAEVYAQLGCLDDCFRWLEVALEERTVAFHLWWQSAGFADARRDPRFRQLLKKVHLV